MRESDIEDYLVKRVKAMGGEVRKVQWIGRSSAPDRRVMLPGQYVDGCCEVPSLTAWVELKSPDAVKTFPANPHERAQHREHQRMRALGQRVEVIGTIEQVEELLK
jgi:hypothetical protein